jgi:DnaK suppressor protein
MTSDLDAVRATLIAERDGLRKRIEDLNGGGNASHIGDDEGFADSGAVTAEKGELLTLLSSLQENLADIEAALARIDDGTFGTCEHCGAQIAPSRLEALPQARLCLECASRE